MNLPKCEKRAYTWLPLGDGPPGKVPVSRRLEFSGCFIWIPPSVSWLGAGWTCIDLGIKNFIDPAMGFFQVWAFSAEFVKLKAPS